jgi:sugar lactone lactonase YvrE
MKLIGLSLRLAAAIALTACHGDPGLGASPAAPLGAAFARPHWTRTSLGKFGDPYGVAVAADGTVYVADPGGKAVWKVTSEGRKTIGSNWPAVAGSKFDPVGISLASNGLQVFVADKGNGALWAVKADNGIVSVGNGFQWPHYPRGAAYAASPGVGYVDVTTASPGTTKGSIRCITKDCPIFAVREFANPYGVAADDRGNVYVADAGAKQVFRIDSSGVTSIGRFVDPYGVAVTPDGSSVYVADAGAKKVLQGTPDGSSWSEIGTFGDPYGVAAAADGSIYVADPGSKEVWKLTP